MSAQEFKDKGNALFKEGNYAGAVEAFTKAMELDPTDKVFVSNRSMAHLAAGNLEEALRDGEACVKLAPAWPKSYSRKAAALFKMDRLEETVEAYEEGLKAVPNDPSLQQGLREAREALDEAMSGGPGGDPLGGLGKIFGEDMFTRLTLDPTTRPLLQDQELVRKLREVQAKPGDLMKHMADPKFSQCLQVLLGMPADMRGPAGADGAGAGAGAGAGNAAAGAGAGSSPSNSGGSKSNSNNNAGNSNSGSSKSSAAAAAAADDDDDDDDADEEMAAEDLTPEEQAERDARRKAAIEHREKKARADELKEQGNELYKNKKLDEALAKYTEAEAICPTEATYANNIGAVLMAKKDYEGAVAASDRAAAAARDHGKGAEAAAAMAKAYARKGHALQLLGRLDEALGALDKSLVEKFDRKVDDQRREVRALKKKADEAAYVDPAKSEEHKNRGNELFTAGKWPEAIAEYTEALRRDPSNYKVLANRALCYTKLLEWQRGLDDCNAILKDHPDFVKAYVRKGKIQFVLKQLHKAQETYAAGLALDPKNADLIAGMQEVVAAMRGGSEEDAEARAREAAKDPEIQAILRDPMVNQAIRDLQSGNREVAEKVSRDAVMSAKIQKLIAAGILRTA